MSSETINIIFLLIFIKYIYTICSLFINDKNYKHRFHTIARQTYETKLFKKKKKNKSKAVRKTSHDANAPRSPIEFREIATGAKITRPRSRFDRSDGLSDRGKSDARKIAPLRPRLTP